VRALYVRQKMKRITLITCFIVSALIVVWPSYEKLEETYQENMFTKLSEDKNIEVRSRTREVILRVGPVRRDELMPWHRVRFGVPFAAITTDTQLDYKIFQMRWEVEPFVANIIISIPVALLVGGSIGLSTLLLKKRP